jgi:hypothetical protein
MITRRGLLKSAIATATVRIAKEEGEAMEQRQHRHARGHGPRRFPALLRAVSAGRTGQGRKWNLRQRLP